MLLHNEQLSDLNRTLALLEYGKQIRTDSLPASAKYLNEALDIAEKIGRDTLMIDIHLALGVSFGMQSDYPQSIEHFQEAVKMATAISDDERTATSLNGLGVVNKRLGDYPASQQYYYKSLEIYEKINDPLGVASCCDNLGVLYDLMDDIDQSRAYYQKALAYYEANNKKIRIAGAKSNLAILLLREKKYDSALQNLREAQAIYDSAGYHSNMINVSTNVGYLFNLKQQYDSAVAFLLPALGQAQQMNLKQEEVKIYYNLADAYLGLNDLKKALSYAQKQVDAAQQLGSASLIRDSEVTISKVYEKMGNSQQALDHYKYYMQWSDSVINEEKARTFKTQEVKMEVLKKDTQLAEQSKTLALQEQTIALEKKWRILLIISVCLLSLAAFMVYQRSLSRKRYSRLLESKNHLISDQKEKIEQAKLELEGRMLRSQLNPHFIFNSLSSIQHFITGNDKGNALRYLSKFSKLLRKVLESSFKLNNVLEEEINLLKIYLELESLRFDGSFSYDIEIDDDLDTTYFEIPTLLLQPFVENSLLHGLLPKEDDKQLTISFSENESLIHCAIVDNGVGRKASKEKNNKTTREGVSRGVSVSEQRITLLARKYNVEAGIHYEDIIDKEGKASGTKVTIDLPKIEAN